MNISINTSLISSAQSYTVGGISEEEEEEEKVQQQKEEEEQSSKSSSIQYTATSSQGDTLEISEEAQAASASSSTATTDLSSYSETQLKEMYNNGEITLAEYQEALAELEEEE